MVMYTDDWDGWFPPFLAYQKPGEPQLNWAGSYGLGKKCDPKLGQLYPYVRNTKVYLCPDMVGAYLPRIEPDALPYPVSYAINNMVVHAATGGPWDPFNANWVIVPARVGLFCEKNYDCLDEPEINWGGLAGHTDEINDGFNTPSDVHNGGSNVVYCDLHARWQSYDSVIQAFKNDDWNPEKP
jgi:prepilin-type processing-associated H-X9-DG protein